MEENLTNTNDLLIKVVNFSWIILIPSQQSALLTQLLPDDEKSLRPSSFTKLKVIAQCESRSRSPSPMFHWLEDNELLQSVVGAPLHCPVGQALCVFSCSNICKITYFRKWTVLSCFTNFQPTFLYEL